MIEKMTNYTKTLNQKQRIHVNGLDHRVYKINALFSFMQHSVQKIKSF